MDNDVIDELLPTQRVIMSQFRDFLVGFGVPREVISIKGRSIQIGPDHFNLTLKVGDDERFYDSGSYFVTDGGES